MKLRIFPWWAWLIVAGIALIVIFAVFTYENDGATETTLADFVFFAESGEVTRVWADTNEIEYELQGDSKTYVAPKEESDSVRQILTDSGLTPEEIAALNIDNRDGGSGLFSVALQFVPIVFIVGILYFFMREAKRAQQRLPTQ